MYQADPAALEPILRVHPQPYLDYLQATCAAGGGMLDYDTFVNRDSWDAALGGVGAAVAALDHALAGRGDAFAAIRPPGHHALENKAMGFCLLANAVIVAREAQVLGTDRVLIVDWDVHHGNGTQALVERDPGIRFVSIHQWPLYPGTGAAAERGVGNLFNVPRPPGLPAKRYVGDLSSAVAAATSGWTPGLVLVSAGYDSMTGDPLGGFTLEPPDYTTLVHRIRELTGGAPIVGLLEGGYAPARVAEGVVATLEAFV